MEINIFLKNVFFLFKEVGFIKVFGSELQNN